MKKINRKVKIGLTSVLGVLLLAACLFGVMQNKQNTDEANKLISVTATQNEKTIEPVNEATAQEQVATEYKETSNSTLSNVSEAVIAKKNDPERFGQLFPDDVALKVTFNGLQTKVAVNNDPDASYKLEVLDDGTKKLSIGPEGSLDHDFDSRGKTPWVDDNQYLISQVEIFAGTAPHATVGWFGCQTDRKSQNTRLSDIKSIIGLDNLNMANVTDASYMFCGSDILTSTPKANTFFTQEWNVEKAEGICDYTNLNNEFINKVANKIANTATNMYFAFANNFYNLTSFEISDSDCKVTEASYMFYKDLYLETIKANKLIVHNNTGSVIGMFRDCSALTTITMDSDTDWSGYLLSKHSNMFLNCNKLAGGKGTRYADKKFADKTYAKIDGGDSSEGYFAVSSTPTKKSLIVDDKQYFPVAGDSLSSDITFYDADGNELSKTGAGDKYQQSDLGGTKENGTTFCASSYTGEGSFNTLRSIEVSWDNTFYIKNEGSATTYPCEATDVKDSFKSTYLVGGTEDTEQVYRLNGNPSGGRATPATYDGVSLTDIWNAYNPGHSSFGFGGPAGSFWSLCANSSGSAYRWYSSNSAWLGDYRGVTDGSYVLVCRAF